MSELEIIQERLFFSKYNYDTQLQVCKSLQSTLDDYKLLSIYRNEWRYLSEKINEIKKQIKLKKLSINYV